MRTDKNLELTRIIGRRLREACSLDTDIDIKLPAAIAGGMAALRDIEIADTADRSKTNAVVHRGSTRRK